MKLRKTKFFTLALALCGHDASAVPDISNSIGGWSNQLAPNVGNVKGNRYNFDLRLDLQDHNSENGVESRLTLNTLVNDAGGFMWSVNEAYLKKQMGQTSLQFGREILDWSDVDDHWSFGKLNHRQNFNYFEPGREGLIGFVLKRQFDNGLVLQAFATPVSAPELNPGLETNNSKGTITSKNPWAKLPASTTTLPGGQSVPVVYNVDTPSISSAILRPAGGVNMGWKNQHWEGGAYYMRKPENSVSSTVDANLDPGVQVNAKVKPQFYYHDLYGGNLRWRNKDVTIYASAIAVRPNTYPDGDPQAVIYTKIETEKRREDYVGGGIAQVNAESSLGIDYVARLSPFNRSDDILAEDPRWNQAVHVWGRRRMNRFFEVFADGKYDMLTTDRLVMFRASYYPVQRVAVTGGVSMIGTPSDGKSYWSPYKNNDSVYASLRYMF